MYFTNLLLAKFPSLITLSTLPAAPTAPVAPPFVTGLQKVLEDVRDWMLILVPAVVVLTFVIGGLMLAKAEDPMETKTVKDRMVKAVVGAAIAGSAAQLGVWLTEIFGLKG